MKSNFYNSSFICISCLFLFIGLVECTTPSELRKLGDEEFMRRKYSESIKYYQQAIELEPKNYLVIKKIKIKKK